jgi:hypothetical protein
MITTLPQVVNAINAQTVPTGHARGVGSADHQSMLAGDSMTSATQLDVLLTWRGRVGLFKKSGHGSTASTPWQLLSVAQAGSGSALDEGFLQCIQLLHGETGLAVRDILTIQPGPTIEVSHGSHSTLHVVYVAETNQRRLALGPEYSVHRWVKKPRIGRFDGGADWLGPVLEAAASMPVPNAAGSVPALAA